MKRFIIRTVLSIFLLVVTVFTGCAQKATTLKDAYKDYFLIGAAINSAQIVGQDTQSCDVLFQHYNTITPENCMKWENIHPKPGVYNFELADKYVVLGETHHMFIVGHCLLWHAQTPRWVFTDSTGKNLSREALLDRLRDHITTIVSRYKGRINGYDVVNEALNEDGSMRKSKWYEIIGDDFIQKAFEFAKAADPNVELYYNDYNIEIPAKRAGAIRIIKDLQSKGIKISGVGIQGHWHLDAPKLVDIDSSIMEFGELGIKVHITEMDINVLPRPENLSGADVSKNFTLTKESNPYPNGLPDSAQVKLTDRYVDMFKIFLKHKDVMKRVTFWGITDGMSWLNGWPIRGRTNYPLLFNRDYTAKPLVNELIKLAQKH
jgi:endo-1,4-beta-xylanase